MDDMRQLVIDMIKKEIKFYRLNSDEGNELYEGDFDKDWDKLENWEILRALRHVHMEIFK